MTVDPKVLVTDFDKSDIVGKILSEAKNVISYPKHEAKTPKISTGTARQFVQVF